MKNLTIAHKIIIGFALTLLITVALGVFASMRLTTVRAYSSKITEDNLPGVYEISKADSLIRENMLVLMRQLNSHDAAAIAECDKQMAQIRDALDLTYTNYGKTIFDPRDKELFDALNAAREEYKKSKDEVLAFSRAMKTEEGFAAFHRLEPFYYKYSDAVRKLVDFNRDSGNDTSAKITSAVADSQFGIVVAIAIAVGLGLVTSFVIIRNTNRLLNSVATLLRASADQVAAAAGQVAQSSQSMAEGASEQASSLEETSASLEEMASMTRQNADNARQASAMSDEASSAAEAGQKLTRTMGQEISQRVGAMTGAIGQIKSSTDQTAKIVKTIDEIAFQTNLLALNAAVEAARAGEAGKGFAVVAEEVRNLAQRSAEAAKTTSSLIEESQRNAENGVKVSNEVAEILKRTVEVEIARSFGNTVEVANKVKNLIGEVAAASSEQSKGAEQINTAVNQMDKVTQSNAANAEETASASEELSAQARELNDMVNTLVRMVRGSVEETSSARPAASAAPASTHTSSVTKKQKSAAPKFQQKKHTTESAPAVPGVNRIKHLNGSANGNGAKPEQVIPLTDAELSSF